MFVIKQPPKIIFGENSVKEFDFPQNCLVITSSGAKSRGWLDYLDLDGYLLFDKVEPNPSLETAQKIISEFQNQSFSTVIGLGGGSSLDVAKYVAKELKKFKIMIPTTFGSGSEVTRISVLKVDGKKQSFHDDELIANLAIVDSNFITNTPIQVIKNAAIDACAQCSEAFDSKMSNYYIKFLCEKAFDHLENALLNEQFEKLPYGSMIAGLGFGNSSTTLGHALSYVFSNEGYSHGHALAFATTVSHRFNNSKFYHRFKNLALRLGFSKIFLKEDLQLAAETILKDRKHLDNNPKNVKKEELIKLLREICDKELAEL